MRRRRRWRSSTTRSRSGSGAARRTRSASAIRVGDGEWRTVVGVAADIKYCGSTSRRARMSTCRSCSRTGPSMILHTRGTAPVDALVDQRARARRRARRRSADPVRADAGRPDEGRAAALRPRWRRCCSCSASPAWRWPRWAPTASCRTPSSRARTKSASAWRSARPRASVVRAFLGRGLRLGAIGAVVGIAAALAVTRLLGSVLFGVSATDPISFARALAIVLGVVVVATLVPAWRAARTNPLSALRHQ